MLQESSNEQRLLQSVLYLAFYRQKTWQKCKLIVLSTGTIISKIFQKQHFRGSAIGAMSSYFRRSPCIQLTISRESLKMQCLSILFEAQTKVIKDTFPKQLLLKCSAKRNNKQLFSQSAPYIIFHQQIFVRNAMFK